MTTAALAIEKMNHHPGMVQRLQSRHRGSDDARCRRHYLARTSRLAKLLDETAAKLQ